MFVDYVDYFGYGPGTVEESGSVVELDWKTEPEPLVDTETMVFVDIAWHSLKDIESKSLEHVPLVVLYLSFM